LTADQFRYFVKKTMGFQELARAKYPKGNKPNRSPHRDEVEPKDAKTPTPDKQQEGEKQAEGK